MGKKNNLNKNSRTYALVYRPRTDPLYGDSQASQWVLTRIHKKKEKLLGEEEDYFDYKFQSNVDSSHETKLDYDPKEFELGEYDLNLKTYNYTQHLREVNPREVGLEEDDDVENPLIQIIREVKERTGQYIGFDMAARELEARKQLEEDRNRDKDIDTVLKLLQDESDGTDYSSDTEELQDDFLLLAQGEDYAESEDFSSSSRDSVMLKSTSSHNRAFLDEKFEKLYAREYESAEDDSSDDYAPSAESAHSKTDQSYILNSEKADELFRDLQGLSLDSAEVDKKYLEMLHHGIEMNSSESTTLSFESDTEDNEAVSSAASSGQPSVRLSLANLPNLIEDELKGLSKQKKKNNNHGSTSMYETNKNQTPSSAIICSRKKTESKEEKKARKQAVKEWKMERRANKSNLRRLFRQERQRQAKQVAYAGQYKVIVDST
eukprot:jgi/Galph1/2524/GphlegSOOS_G1190.1